MLKAQFLMAMMASSLIACGGDSSSSNNQTSTTDYSSPSPVVDHASNPVPLGQPSYETLANSACGSYQQTFIDVSVSGVSEVYRGYPISSTGTLNVLGTANHVCIDGSLAATTLDGGVVKLYVAGDLETLNVNSVSSTVYVYGDVDQLHINGGMHKVLVFGRIGFLQFSEGSIYNEVFYSEIGSYDDLSVDSTENDLIDLSVGF